ncbi:DUF6151 family protein [uncultured Paraglaciecola sp.]|uniref:DUF6151 family protein n=1 Tax=uncultured Paraglaciecola sp. TaxID=1765024 RepID=UPI002609E4F9|nr:DUF6151 family protein [uncultured Paraglaciecola sp.]
MNVNLSCRCKAVQGVALNLTPKNGNRLVCCCDDCQAFANYLNQEGDILDEFGGTEIFQTSQSQVRIDSGAEHLRCLRLKPKGLNRWYSHCCNTPVANTMGAKSPFVGLIHSFINIEGERHNTLGAIRTYVQTQHAHGTPTYPHKADKFPLGITLRMIRMMLMWKLKGMHQPSAKSLIPN